MNAATGVSNIHASRSSETARNSLLIVDDHADSRDLLALHLEEDGYLLDFAADGAEALLKIKTGSFDLVLLDDVMPELNGVEVLCEIRQHYSMQELPVIMVTFHDKSEDIAKALSLGANDYLAKPVDALVMRSRVATHLKLKRLAESNNEFLGIAAHDIKKPLMLMMDMVETLQEDFPDGAIVTAELHETLDMVVKTGTYMQRIVQDYLDLSVVENGDIKIAPAPLDLNVLVRRVVRANTDYALKKDHQIITELDGALPKVRADEIRLIQVIDNLVGNAIKFSPLGATTRISTCLDKGCVILRVQDSGPGFSEHDLNKVFVEKCVRLGNRPTGSEKSTGLGLSICKKIINLHWGEIGVFNNLQNPGATFWFQLPVQPTATQR